MPLTGLPCYKPVDRSGAAIQDAIDSASAAGGGIVYLEAGASYAISAPLTISGSTVAGVADAGVRVWGAGPNGTILEPDEPTTAGDSGRLAIEASFAEVAGVTLRGYDADVAPQVVIGTGASHPIRRARLASSRIEISETEGVQFHAGSTSVPATADCVVDNCLILGNDQQVPQLIECATGTTRPRIRQSQILNYGGVAIGFSQSSSPTVESVLMRSEGTDSSAIQVTNSQNGLVAQAWLEEQTSSSYFLNLLAGCGGWTTEACTFRRSGAGDTEPHAISAGGATSGAPCTLVIAYHSWTAGGAPTSATDGHIRSNTTDSAAVPTEITLLGGVACGAATTAPHPVIAKVASMQSPLVTGTDRLRIPTTTSTSQPSPFFGELLLNRTLSAEGQLKIFTPAGWKTVLLAP